MSQFDTPSFGDEMVGERKTSGLAIGSLVCSLICCIPVTTILGVLLGIGAMVSISGNPASKGKGLAVAGIILGVVFTMVQAVAYPKGWELIKLSFETVERGPREALAAGFAGDIAGFKGSFHGAGATATDAEAQVFIDELRSRYGEFVDSQMYQQQQSKGYGTPMVPFAYAAEFANENVDVETQIVFSDPQKGGFIMKIGYITVFDDELGDLTYPPDGG